jgi:hypothetical protein
MSEKKLTFSKGNLLCFLELRQAQLRTRSNLTGYTGTAQLKGHAYTYTDFWGEKHTATYDNVTDPDDQRWQDYWEIMALDRLWHAINDREWQEELQDFWDATNEGRVKYSRNYERFTITPKESA